MSLKHDALRRNVRVGSRKVTHPSVVGGGTARQTPLKKTPIPHILVGSGTVKNYTDLL